MPTRRKFIAITAAAAATATVLPAVSSSNATTDAPVDGDARRPETHRADRELVDSTTRAALAQSVPFPEG